MKKLLAFILALSIFTLAGCSRVGDLLSNTQSDLSSQINVITSDIVSSNESEDITSEEVSSDDTSSQASEIVSTPSAETVTSSTTEITSQPAVSNTETPSVSTPTTTKPTTYFEKRNLKLTPVSNSLCLNDEPGHTCPYDKEISLSESSVGENENLWDMFDKEIFGDSFEPSTYKSISYFFHAKDTWDLSCKMSKIIIFDKYTGAILRGGKLGEQGWQELIIANKKIYICHTGGGYAGGYGEDIYCPIDYDGAIFAIVKNIEIPYTDIYEGKVTQVDEIIDFENDKYYLFAAN